MGGFLALRPLRAWAGEAQRKTPFEGVPLGLTPTGVVRIAAGQSSVDQLLGAYRG
jgi:hypothetical protein